MVGLLVLVPGMDETLRISGSAQITDDQRLLAGSAVQGRVPGIGLLANWRGVSSLSQGIRSIYFGTQKNITGLYYLVTQQC